MSEVTHDAGSYVLEEMVACRHTLGCDIFDHVEPLSSIRASPLFVCLPPSPLHFHCLFIVYNAGPTRKRIETHVDNGSLLLYLFARSALCCAHAASNPGVLRRQYHPSVALTISSAPHIVPHVAAFLPVFIITMVHAVVVRMAQDPSAISKTRACYVPLRSCL
ncbi:hypothetical protein C8R45DRAFT_1180843 [Mycena sanguinolenta]|nr:hypothetical protein C8R45DRAFT_1180843 [Mycena sanguinolenta]